MEGLLIIFIIGGLLIVVLGIMDCIHAKITKARANRSKKSKLYTGNPTPYAGPTWPELDAMDEQDYF